MCGGEAAETATTTTQDSTTSTIADTTTSTIADTTTSTSSSTTSTTTTTVVKEEQAEPSIEFVNCVDTVITDETYELTYDVIAGNEDMNYFFVSTYKNGEYVNRAYFDKENNPGVGLFPLANTSGRYGSLVDNSDGSGTDIYEITISVSDEGDGSADAICTLTMRNESNTTTTVQNTTTTSSSTTSTTTTTVPVDYPQLTIAEVSNSIPDYNRDDWNHWIDENGDCQNTRHEVLIEESQETVTYTSSTYCSVSTGKWYGFYTGQYYYNASELDIDHFIPLKNAHQSGGYNWTSAKKEEFANYRLDPDSLIAVNLSANRSKGAKGPDEWKPSNTDYWCEYAYDWIRIKDYWNLTATQAEWDALVSMIDTCPDGFKYADAQVEPVVELPTPTTTSTTTTTTTVQPGNPGDTKNCGDFSNYSEAKDWIDTYYPYYGDVANLDGDNDGEPCESLPGGP